MTTKHGDFEFWNIDDDPELVELKHHPAVQDYVRMLNAHPGTPPYGVKRNFHRLIAKWNKEQEIEKKFKWLAENPPDKKTKLPCQLSPLTYNLQPKTKLGQKVKLRIDIHIPATTSEHIRERLLFQTTSVIDAMFQNHSEPPPAAVITHHFKRFMLAELTELGLNIFRFHIFEPEPIEGDSGVYV